MLGTRLFWDCGSQSALVSLDGWYTLGQKRECECQCSLKSPFAMNIRRISGIFGTRIRLRVTWGKHGPRLQFFSCPSSPAFVRCYGLFILHIIFTPNRVRGSSGLQQGVGEGGQQGKAGTWTPIFHIVYQTKCMRFERGFLWRWLATQLATHV